MSFYEKIFGRWSKVCASLQYSTNNLDFVICTSRRGICFHCLANDVIYAGVGVGWGWVGVGGGVGGGGGGGGGGGSTD